MRFDYMDVLRATAIILVLWIHSWDTFFIPTEFAKSPFGWAIHQFSHTIGRYGVPFFIMITGALMLPRPYLNISHFFRTKIPNFLFAIVIASLIYTGAVSGLFGTTLNGFFGRIINGDPIGAYHLWYMYMLVAIYCSLPFLARLIGNLNEREVLLLLTGTLALVSLPLTLQAAGSWLKYYPNQHFIIQTYTFYAILGYWLHNYNGMAAWKRRYRAIGACTLLAATVALKLTRDYNPTEVTFSDGITWYDSILIILPSALIFTIIRDTHWQDGHFLSACRYIAKASYSIYLWHLLGIYLIIKTVSELEIAPVYTIPLAMGTGLLIGLVAYILLKETRARFLVA